MRQGQQLGPDAGSSGLLHIAVQPAHAPTEEAAKRARQLLAGMQVPQSTAPSWMLRLCHAWDASLSVKRRRLRAGLELQSEMEVVAGCHACMQICRITLMGST